MAFQLYQPTLTGRQAKAPELRITPRGTLTISPTALALLDNPEYVCLWWDAETRRIAITAAEATHPAAVHPTRKGREQSGRLTAGFANANGIVGPLRLVMAAANTSYLIHGIDPGTPSMTSEPVPEHRSPSVSRVREMVSAAVNGKG